MKRGSLSLSDIGPFDLQATLESGQSFRWTREDGSMYDDRCPSGGCGWYTTVVSSDQVNSADAPEVIRVRQVEDRLEWEASFDAEASLIDRLRLDDDLRAIRAATPSDAILETAFDRYWGIRLVRDPPVSTLIAFICSSQMRVSRIHEMQRALETQFGESVTFDGREYHAFPTADRLADTSERALRELGLGYRAPYVLRTATLIADGDLHPREASELAYEPAREYLTQFVGVGDKVADCVLLFSLGFLESVPLDTWIRSMIEKHFPACDQDGYAETSRAIRERLGGIYAGYAQTYLFHHLRTAQE